MCSCRNYGLHCARVCKNCYGELCTSVKPLTAVLSDTENEDDEEKEYSNGVDIEEPVTENECPEYEMPQVHKEVCE